MSMTFRTLSWRMCVGIVSLLAVAGCGDANVHDQLATLRAKEAAGFGRIRSSVEAQGGGPLHAYAREGLSPFSVTWAVTSAGKDVNAKDNRGQTPLHLVAMHAKESQTLDVAARLIHHGANVNAKDSNGQTPLHLAAMHAKESRALDVVAGLIHHGANVNAKDSNGQTPLHFTAMHAKGVRGLAVAARLIHHGANVNAKDSNGQTPLHLAAAHGHAKEYLVFGPAVAAALVHHGANVNVKDSNGQTPLDLAPRGSFIWKYLHQDDSLQVAYRMSENRVTCSMEWRRGDGRGVEAKMKWEKCEMTASISGDEGGVEAKMRWVKRQFYPHK